MEGVRTARSDRLTVVHVCLRQKKGRGPGSVTLNGSTEIDNLTSQSPGTRYDVLLAGARFYPKGYWKTQESSMGRLLRANRVEQASRNMYYVRYFDDFGAFPIADNWDDTAIAGFTANKRYVVETSAKVIQRCILMATDPSDLVLDPTCGSGTTAYVAEQWGRRWITIDTSRVALALARSRIMGARYPYYLLADSREGRIKEAELSRKAPSESPTYGDIRQGFVYQRVPHITLKSIANNTEIDDIYDRVQPEVETALADLNLAMRDQATLFDVETGGRKGDTIDFTAADGRNRHLAVRRARSGQRLPRMGSSPRSAGRLERTRPARR